MLHVSCIYINVYICIRTHTHHVFHLVSEGQCPVCEGCDTILEVHSRFRLIKSRLINATATALHVGYPSFLFQSSLCFYFVILDPCWCKKFG